MRTAIIGGGISGLTTAYLLKQNGVEIKLFEKNLFAGGNIRTESTGGYLLEHGPNSTLDTTPLIDKLLGMLGILDRKIYATEKAKKRYILKGGKLHPLPMGPGGFLRTKLFSASAKLGLLKEPFNKTKSNEFETIGEFTKRRLGQEFLDYAINPFVAGVFAGDPNKLNVKTAFPKLYELEQEYGSLIGGTFKSRKARKKRGEESKQSAKMFSFKDGLKELSQAIHFELKDNVLLGADVTRIEKIDSIYRVFTNTNGTGGSEDFDSLVMSAPAHSVAKLLERFDASLAADLKDVNYPSVAVIMTGFNDNALNFKPDGFGFLIPEKENRRILGSLWSSVIFPGRAPEGHSLFTNFVGGSRSPENYAENDENLLKIVLSELKDIMNINGQPELVKIIRWPEAIPQYGVNYSSVSDKIEKFQNDSHGMFICSNYYKGISVCDCVKNAFAATEKVIEYNKAKQV
jgi:oxygen-dependent protoporphyrinogen oxidase